MAFKISLGRILGTVTGMALSGPGGAVLGGLTGGLVDAILPDVGEKVGDVLGEVGTKMLTASAESVQARLAAHEEALDSDLQLALRDAFCEALYDIGGKRCFPDEWESERDVPGLVVYPRTPEGNHLWRNQNPLAQQVCESLHQMVEAANDGTLFSLTPSPDQLEAQVQTYLQADTLAEAQSALFRQMLAPYLPLPFTSEVPGFLEHLRRYLVPRLLVHLSNFLKQRPPAWREFNRLLLEQLQAQVQTVANSQQEVRHELTQIVQRLDAILAQDNNVNGQALTEWANGLANLLAAIGQLEQRLDEKLDYVLTSVVEGNRDVVERLESLTVVIGKVGEDVERTESKVDHVIYLLTQREANINSINTLLESIVADVRGARLPSFVMQNGRLIAQVHATPVMLRERQSNYFERHRFFAGRAAEIERIHDFLESQSSGYIFVTGPSGYGKTALLANIVAPQRTEYIWYFLNQLDGTNNRRDFLRQMCEQMLAYYQMPVHSQYDLPEHADHLEALYARLLRMPLVQANQPLVLVIDGLDEAANNFISDLHIPRHLPEGKFIIFSARETGRDYLEELGLPSDKVLTINLELLSYAGVQTLLQTAGATAWANDTTLVGEVLRVSEGDPFYLHELVQDIAEGQITAEQITHQPAGLTTYLDGWWQQVESALSQDEKGRLAELMGILMVARGPLPRVDISRIYSLGLSVGVILKPVRRFIVIQRWHGQEAVALCHPRFQKYLVNDKFPDIGLDYRKTLLVYCAQWQQHNSRYALQHYAAHLAEAEQWNELHTLVATGDERIEWAEARHAAEGTYTGYLEDLQLAWAHADEVGKSNPVEAVGYQVRYALIKSSIHSLAANIWPKLLVALVEKKVWTPKQGLVHAKLMPDEEQREKAFVGLAAYLPDDLLCDLFQAVLAIQNEERQLNTLVMITPDLSEELLHKLLEIVQGLKPSEIKVAMLLIVYLVSYLPEVGRKAVEKWRLEAEPFDISLASHLPVELLREVLEVAQVIESDSDRAEILGELAPCLPDQLLHEVLELARVIESRSDQAQALASVAPHLPIALREDVLREALEVGQAIKHDFWRAKALKKLVPHLPQPLLDEAIQVAQTIGFDDEPNDNRSDVLALIVERLADKDEAIKVARMIDSDYQRALALAYLVIYLPDKYEAIQAVQMIDSDYQQARALDLLVSHLPDKGEAIDVVEKIQVNDLGIRAQASLAQYLSESQKVDLLHEVIRVARWEFWYHSEVREPVLTHLVPHLDSSLLDYAIQQAQSIGDNYTVAFLAPHLPDKSKAIQAVRMIKPDRDRINALTSLLPFLPGSLMPEAINITWTISEDYQRAEMLSFLGPYLPPSLWHEAIKIAWRMKENIHRARALASLTPRLPPSLLREALQIARRIGDNYEQAQTLASLAPYCPSSLWPKVLEVTQSIRGDILQAQILSQLVPYLPSALLDDFQKIVLDITADKYRGEVLATLVPYLPDEYQALDQAWKIKSDSHRVQAMATIVPYVQEHRKDELLNHILQVARQNRFNKNQTSMNALVSLAPHLSRFQLGETIDMAWESTSLWALTALLPYLRNKSSVLHLAQTIENDNDRVQAMASLAPYLPTPVRENVLRDALETAKLIKSDWRRADALVGLAPHLQDQHLQEALKVASAIKLYVKGSEALASLVPQLPDNLQALEVTQAITDDWRRAQALASLAPRLPDKLLPKALEVAQAMGKNENQVKALASLTPRLSINLRERVLRKALEVAQTIEISMYRAQALVFLAPQLAALPLATLYPLWRETLLILAERTRQDLLADLGVLVPVIVALGGEEAAKETAQAVLDVRQCWL